MNIKMKCPCETDVNACCACVSMHCDECHGHSKFRQGSYCSSCGRPLKAELRRNYVPRTEVERLEHLRAELSKEVADLKDELMCEKETNAHLCGEYMASKSEAIKEYLAKVLEKKDIAGHYVPDYEVVSVGVLEYYAKVMMEGDKE